MEYEVKGYLDFLVAGALQVRPHFHQDRLNGVSDGVHAVDGTLGVWIVAFVEVGLGLQPGRAQLPALVRPAQGLLVPVQLPQHSLGENIALRPVRGLQDVSGHIEGRRKALVHQVSQVEDWAARLRGCLLARGQGYERNDERQGCQDDPDHYPAGMPLQKGPEFPGERLCHGDEVLFNEQLQ